MKDEIRIQESEFRIQNERPEGKRKKAERRTDQNVGALLAGCGRSSSFRRKPESSVLGPRRFGIRIVLSDGLNGLYGRDGVLKAFRDQRFLTV